MGIDNDTHVVVYDHNPKFGLYSAGRVWWMFKVHMCCDRPMSTFHRDHVPVRIHLSRLSNMHSANVDRV